MENLFEFKIEDVEVKGRGARKEKEKESILRVLPNLKAGQSIFIEATMLSTVTVREIIKNLNETSSDRRYVLSIKDKPVKGTRIGVKFYRN
ncbi:MAG: hypothetical protein ACK53T_07790 [Planctomycetota bacterium]|jgi:hypothetical protein